MATRKTVKRVLVLVVGGTVLAAGVAMIVLPGPAFIVIPVGLAILAAEFAWARRLLRKAEQLVPPKARPKLDRARAWLHRWAAKLKLLRERPQSP